LKQGDHIISFAGVPIASRDQLIDLIRSVANNLPNCGSIAARKKWRLTSRRPVDPTTKGGRIGVALV